MQSQALSSVESNRDLPLEILFRCPSLDENSRALSTQIQSEFGLSPVAAHILIARGFTSSPHIREFLAPSFRDHLPSPELIKNLEAAALMLLTAIEEKKNILLYADFDVDGLSSGAQLLLALRKLGAKVDIYIPSRFTEGYGLVMSAVDEILRRGVEVLVTLDCGISSIEEVTRLKKHGVSTLILDHHQPSRPDGVNEVLPPADIVVDPAQHGCLFQEHKLAAAGLVWMFLVMLRKKAVEKNFSQVPDPKDFLDLAALGTICDMVPLRGVNRLLAVRGLEALERSSRPGLLALKRVAGIPEGKRLTCGHVGFALGPRINAAGRLADGREVIHLLTTSDSIRAKTVAELLGRLNEQRRSVEENVKEACFRKLDLDPESLSHSAIVVFGEEFHPGVIGIVAQRLVEKYARPAIVLAPGELNINGRVHPVIKGSIRSVPGFHIADALASLKGLLVSGGGHAEAGGCTLFPEKLPAFQSAFLELADRLLPRESLTRKAHVDLEVTFHDLDIRLAQELQRFSPFGVANPSPVFLSREVLVDSVSSIGNNHLKFRCSQDKVSQTAVAWGFQGHPFLKKGQVLNLIYQLEVNTYQGVSSVQLNLREAFR